MWSDGTPAAVGVVATGRCFISANQGNFHFRQKTELTVSSVFTPGSLLIRAGLVSMAEEPASQEPTESSGSALTRSVGGYKVVIHFNVNVRHAPRADKPHTGMFSFGIVEAPVDGEWRGDEIGLVTGDQGYTHPEHASKSD